MTLKLSMTNGLFEQGKLSILKQRAKYTQVLTTLASPN